MNKKGFTLVELMVSISIMMLLAVMLIPAINTVRNKVLQQLYDAKIEQILSSSKAWGRDNLIRIPQYVNSTYYENDQYRYCDQDCACVLVKELINQGYIAGDSKNKTELKNPLDKKSMNNTLVCVRYDTNDAMTRKIISYIADEGMSYYDNSR